MLAPSLCIGIQLMNHVYRLVFNHSRKCWSVVSEQAVARGKKASSRTGRPAARFASMAVISVLGTALSSNALAECKTPLQWLTGASNYYTPIQLTLPGIANMKRTPDAGYGIYWGGYLGARGQPGQDMPSAWMDHYCESNPPVPQSQELSVFIQGGKGGNGVQDLGNGGDGGRGGHGGDIFLGVLENNGVIATTRDKVNALSAVSRGGDGAVGGSAGSFGSRGGNGGQGGNGGLVSLLNVGTLRTSGGDADAMYALSEGGAGERAGSGSWVPWGTSGTAGSGGNSGSKVSASNLGSLSTSGVSSDGIHIRSAGGNGGKGGTRIDVDLGFVAIGGDAGNGGNGGEVRVLNKGSINTSGAHADAISIQSVGGGGGDGGQASSKGLFSSVAIGGSGGGGGSAGSVEVVNERGSIRTSGRDALGIRAQSLGGGGGNGGNSNAGSVGLGVSSSTSIGGSGGNGGHGAAVQVANLAQSSIVTNAELGDRFRNAVNMEMIDPLTSPKFGYKEGTGAHGIFAQSSGGGGGSGGSSIAVSVAAGNSFSLAVSTALGGSGGDGGKGGQVRIINADSTVSTHDRFSHALFAQSVGGGGGSGGDTFSVAAAASVGITGNVNVGLGGTGGGGGVGGDVYVETGTALTTWGASSHAVLAQSIGGGGGNGGSTMDIGAGIGTSALTIGVKLGGTGGSGNSGNIVNVNSSMSTANTRITTVGDNSIGIVAQSLGGGGGNGGSIKSYAIAAQLGKGVAGTASVNLGGIGGHGGLGGPVTTAYNGSLNTWGSHAPGILAQSIGGGGGVGGSVSQISVAASLNLPDIGMNAGKAVTATVNMGGTGGSGNHASTVTSNLGSNSRISTAGTRSPGLIAQSIGGGGGKGGDTHSFTIATSLPSLSAGGDSTLFKAVSAAASLFSNGIKKTGPEAQPSYNLTANVGGTGGAGGNGAQVWSGLSGTISTLGNQSHGVFAQSIGGGGGSGGSALTTGAEGISGTAIGISLGGSGGGGGNGGVVLVGIESTPATISTQGESAVGIMAQSIGGGGGEGGVAAVNFEDYTATMSKPSVSFSLGGKGGTAGNGSTIRIFNAANISTAGSNATGILAQSIGGGGGVAGSSGAPTGLINVGLGGNGAGGGSGADVHVGHFGVTTRGDNAIGVLAQSIGGGGGAGGAAYTATNKVSLTVAVGGQGGSAGNGGIVNVGCLGDYANTVGCARNVSTAGKVAHAIMAQSIGGGGGLTQITKFNILRDPIGDTNALDIELGSFGRWKDTWNGNSGKVSVHDYGGSRFDIRTTGAGAIGIIAQSLSGGGGAVSLDKETGGYSVKYTNGIQIEGNGTGTNGGVDINLSGSVVTTGAYAHGIYAQALAGSQTVFSASGAQVFGGTSAANGRIEVRTAASANVSATGKGAYAISSISNYASNAGMAQWLLLHGNISATGQDAWAVNVQNGHSNIGWNRNTDSRATIEVYGAVTGQALTAGGVTMRNYQGQNQLFVKPGARIQIHGRTTSSNCPASGCVAVSMVSPVKNHLIVDPAASISGGSVQLSGGENIVEIHGSLNGVAEADGMGGYMRYSNPSLQIANGSAAITVHNGGRINGRISAPSASGLITNKGIIDGAIQAPAMGYSMTGTHILKVFGDGRNSDAVHVSGLNIPSDGKFRVELLSLPGGSFTPFNLITARTMNIFSDPITAAGAGTQLTYDSRQDSSGNSLFVLTNVRVGFKSMGLPPQLDSAIDLAEDQANAGFDDDDSSNLPTTPPSSELYDLLLDMANEDDTSTLAALLDNFSLGYSDATLALASAWYAANHMQSCGDYKVSSTSAIEQGDCSWVKLAYDDMELDRGAQKGHNWGFNAGVQRQFTDHVYVGMSAGIASTEFVNFGRATSEGERLNVGAIAKYVNGNVFGAASVVGGYSQADGERDITVPGLEATAKSDRETWLLSTRVRGGYNFELDQGFSVTPSLELNVPLVRDNGYREKNGGEFNMEVLSSTNVVPDLYPAVQLSKQFRVREASVRGWVELGQRLRFGDDLKADVRMPDGFAPDAVTRLNYDPGQSSTIWSTGLLIESGEQLEVRLMYENERGNGMKSQSGSFKFAWKF